MKLLRYGLPGHEKLGVLDLDGQIRDLSQRVPDIEGQALLAESFERLKRINFTTLPLVNPKVRIGPCVNKVGKFTCVGLNYADHADESGVPVPKEPVLFTKATSSISGPNDDVTVPRGSEKRTGKLGWA
jgi:2,4-diketo-3-deoxy-L-fuconate hydrolase